MQVLRKAIELAENGEEFVLAIIVGKSGSAPQVPGAKSLFLRDGRIVGTIGGGCLEMEARRLALESLATGIPLLREFQLNDDFGWDDGLICGGRVHVLLLPDPAAFLPAFQRALTGESGAILYDCRGGTAVFVGNHPCIETRREVMQDGVFAEPYVLPEQLIVFGGGHVGSEIGKLAAAIGFSVTLVDDRPEFVSETRAPWANRLVCELPDRFASELETDIDTYLCLVTRGHRNDARVLREVIGKPRAYLGMIGSKRKREVVRRELVSSGICTEEEFALVRSPMGLDIGAETVAEIAVSVAAELVQVRAQRRGPISARCDRSLSEPITSG
jgi:xanthine dehydrogenase accessory factor